MMITTLAKGSYCPIEPGKDIVISSNDKWVRVWDSIHKDTCPRPSLPEVDFNHQTVLASFMGTRPTGGYSIEIHQVKKEGEKIVATIKTQSPEPGEMVTMAITRPFHVVMVDVADKEIEFKRK